MNSSQWNITDLAGGMPMPSCNGSLLGIHSPSLSITACVAALLALGFGITSCRYNRIRLFGRTIRSTYISNHLWVYFFLVVAAEMTLQTVRYALNTPNYIYQPLPEIKSPSLDNLKDSVYWKDVLAVQRVDSGMLTAQLTLRVVSLFLLALALLWQCRYRSGNVPMKDSFMPRYRRFQRVVDEDSESASLISPSESVESVQECTSSRNIPIARDQTSTSVYEVFIFVLFIITLISLYFNLTYIPGTDPASWFYGFVILTLVWQVVIIILSIAVLSSPTSPSSSSTEYILSLSAGENQPEGPSYATKTYLLIGMLLHTIYSFIPLNLYSRFFFALSINNTIEYAKGFMRPDLINDYPNHKSGIDLLKCFPLFNTPWFTVMDIVQFTGVLSLVFIFLFVRYEFMRVKERCIWFTVRRVTGTFGFSYFDER